MAKIFIKEINELLTETVKFFQTCCNPITSDDKNTDETIEVNGLLVNCLPCHPQNLNCYYKLGSDIPKIYLETFFSPLIEEQEEFQNENYDLPLAPTVEVDVKKEVIDAGSKGQLISKCPFIVFKSPKKQQKCFKDICPSL